MRKKIVKYFNLILSDFHVFFYFKDWLLSILNKNNYVSKYPWMTYRFITWASKNLNNSHVLLEFGSGNSTLYFSSLCKEITSIEHDFIFFSRTIKRFKSISNINYVYVDESSYLNYCDDNIIAKYNVLIIDGIKRVEVFNKYSPLIKNGFIILDNAERDDYNDIHNLLSKYEYIEFPGLSPYNAKITMTKVWFIK